MPIERLSKVSFYLKILLKTWINFFVKNYVYILAGIHSIKTKLLISNICFVFKSCIIKYQLNLFNYSVKFKSYYV